MSRNSETGAHRALVAAAALRADPRERRKPSTVGMRRLPASRAHDGVPMSRADIVYRAIEARAIHVCGLAGITLPGEPL